MVRHEVFRSKSTRGFTLVELMVVVAVLAIITTVALPGLLNARMAANETSAIATLKQVFTSQSQYRIRYGAYATLTDLVATGMLDDGFADAERSGYTFANVTAPTNMQWDMKADPTTPGNSGNRYFFVDGSGVIRQREGGSATSADPPVGSE